MNFEVNRKCTITFFNTLGLFGYFFPVVAHLCFGLGRGPITPSGPAMALTDRKDLNLTKKVSFFVWTAETRSTIKVLFSLYFVSDPESESESEPESESIRSPESESESESESEQRHHDSALGCPESPLFSS